MEDHSVFMDKAVIPNEVDLNRVLGSTVGLWKDIHKFVFEKYPSGLEDWNFPGKKYGWSFRIKDKKRAIIYFLPRQDFFKVAFVFGQKAFDAVMLSDIDKDIKTTLQQAVKYAEGRGVSLDVRSKDQFLDIKKLIEIKLAY